MIETKLLEIRDHGTCLVAVCMRPWPVMFDNAGDETQRKLASRWEQMLWRYGYKENRCVIMFRLSNPDRGCQNEPYGWGDRTMKAAHGYIEAHWEEIAPNEVIDVRVILGEAEDPAPSEFIH